MPFWWNRRRKPWFGHWRNKRRARYKRRTYWRRRRRPRRFTRRRRRRRRRHKVRRKKPTISLKQWQPDSINKCKIIGYGTLVAGAEGNQFRCYTHQKFEYTQPKAPGGGGFGVEQFSLQYLYNEWLARKNVWTKSNDYKELCRYTGASFTFYRHKFIDFVIQYDRDPPFTLQKLTYTNAHPQNLLLSKRHRILLSESTNPKGKVKLKIKVKPPRKMSNKWFFQEDLAPHNLVKLTAAAVSFPYSLYGPNTQSPNITLYSLNINFYRNQNWQQDTGEKPYLPYAGFPSTGIMYKYKNKDYTMNPANYKASINMTAGFWDPTWLQGSDYKTSTTQTFLYKPITVARYNPEDDSGVGNRVWLTSIISDHKWNPPQDNDLIMTEEPLYLAFWGFYDYIIKAKKTKEYMSTHMFVIKSKAIKLLTPNTTQELFPIVDLSFIQGKMPFDEQLTLQETQNWYPTVKKQIQTINAIVECGPYVPKLYNLPSSTWQLTYKYHFYFKWGGSYINDQLVHNPQDQGKYPVPNIVIPPVQISDPLKQTYQTMLRQWDYRRGFITSTALKRMHENIQTHEYLSTDDSETTPKKKKITSELQCHQEETEEMQTCLQELCKENTCQESQDLHQLIAQQQQQQEHLKHNLLKLLIEMKKKQRYYQLQTGLL
nr:MAG: ORF1 [Torque teno midi virus]